MNRSSHRAWVLALALLALSQGLQAGPAGSAASHPAGWAFQPLASPAPPEVKDAGWVRTPIDRFILARLERENRPPAPQAGRRTLVRRAFLDLLGIPPTPEEAEAFLQDPAPDAEAWRGLVRGLLARPEHGERWARHWLDVARFAESSGFEHDYDRPHAYHYRDFVIRALNEDMPYDRFVRWQLAGDEFEPDTPLALMATGFLGAGVFPTQITANEVERTRYDAMDDMLSTAGSAFLGLTVGCARCHDHKFDPVSSEEYYRLLSSFTTTTRSEVELDLDPETSRKARAAFDAAHAPLAQDLADYEQHSLPARFQAWLRAGAPVEQTPEWWLPDLTSIPPVSAGGARLEPRQDGSFLATGPNADQDRYTFTTDLTGAPVAALRLEALADPGLVRGGPGRADNGNFALSRIRARILPRDGSPPQDLALRAPRASFEQNTQTLSIAASLDEDPRTGWAVDPRFGTNHAATFEFPTTLVPGPEGIRLQVILEFAVNTRHHIGRPRISLSANPKAALDAPVLPARIGALLARLHARTASPSALSADEETTLRAWWKSSDPGWRERADAVEAHARTAPKPTLTKVLACVEGHTPVRMHTQGADFFPETYILKRGSPDQKQGVATQGFLKVLSRAEDPTERWGWKPPEGARFSGRRRSLAEWLTDSRQGAGHLLARVMVNRLWQHHFGTGLVATPNDFGSQGASPSHPELLDWLAGELIRRDWHLKALHELIMVSAVYQQSSAGQPGPSTTSEPAHAAKASLFQGYPARRLEAEAIRDSILAVCGVLDPRRQGPGTLDEASTRRSIYLTVKRSRLIPSLQVFDAPEPLVSQGSRPATTVAPQALLLLNSPQVRNWATRFAERIDASPQTPPGDAVDRAYRLALVRPATGTERAAGAAFLQSQTREYADRPPAEAWKLALTDLAQAILGLNEFLHVD